ncbi:hypothetical protein L596_016688 [Steinernema carpocapsae]|uniref:Uncharacterized protein n=1 Tax=Steinernema carpocapsae TaxID=34508 RepID=A0A4U5NJJ7_STECR|nr:hypothetical protein L596_016688 [Steinernema carpocapsae]
MAKPKSTCSFPQEIQGNLPCFDTREALLEAVKDHFGHKNIRAGLTFTLMYSIYHVLIDMSRTPPTPNVFHGWMDNCMRLHTFNIDLEDPSGSTIREIIVNFQR